MLQSDKIYLRPLEESDVASFYAWVNDADVIKTIGHVQPYSLSQCKIFVTPAGGVFRWGIVKKDDCKLIGSASLYGIDSHNGVASFKILIGDRGEWNKGYGTSVVKMVVDYAFECCNLSRVQLNVHADNQHAIKAYLRAGFLHEGLMRKAVYRDGKFVDTCIMAILKSDCRNLPNRRDEIEAWKKAQL